jgi:outer membrane protein OmpA-like peptidoglycan-associated protein
MPKAPVAAAEGQTAPASDRDKDGVPDDKDACPDDAGVKTDDPKTNGCPPPADRDKDGIVDDDDACPDTAGIKTDDPKTNGCPPPPPDRDGDGIVDAEDACPDQPGVKTDDPQTNGCPADPDRDKDGIPNDDDACPDQAGPADKDPKRNGCPKAFIQGSQIRILDQVKFATGSSAIVRGKESDEVLGAVLKILTDHPEITALRVEGHTDNQGAASTNKTLSEQRAASVVHWLVQHGIDASRLSSQGFGYERPIDSNETPEGRKNNRRVEFHIADAPAP